MLCVIMQNELMHSVMTNCLTVTLKRANTKDQINCLSSFGFLSAFLSFIKR
jgi:hypothetical protein